VDQNVHHYYQQLEMEVVVLLYDLVEEVVDLNVHHYY